VAVSDERKVLATSLKTVAVSKKQAGLLQAIQKELAPFFPIEQFIIGLPLLLSGKEGEMALEAKAFGKALSDYFGLPVLFWDERLTSLEAERLMKESLLSRKERALRVDGMAACLILQNYLDSLQFKTQLQNR
jgi:putative Holliday junction resolvase